MEYSELKEKTWIYFDNKYHFVQELNEGFILLAYSPIEYIPILKTLENDELWVSAFDILPIDY